MAEAKATYNEALKNLEQISEEIHRMRKERESSARYHENGGSHNRGECDGGNAHSHSAAEGGIDDSVGGGYRADLTDVINRLDSSDINSTDEYLDFPSQMTIKSSPIRQKKIDKLDCPHLYRDFTAPSTAGGGGMVSWMWQFDANEKAIQSFSDWRRNRALDRNPIVQLGEFQFHVLAHKCDHSRRPYAGTFEQPQLGHE